MDTIDRHRKIIEALGDTCAVARLCKVRPPSVSKWKHAGIPQARLMYLEAKFQRIVRPILEAT